ncbi:MAG: SpvB/TcaC N-terminal domain-containing protein, partial [Bacteroidota bacterium]
MNLRILLLTLLLASSLYGQNDKPTAIDGITFIEPPQANNRGTAALSYPLTLPPGRKGVQPDLNITYDSDGSNSWLGLGWNLDLPSITIDSRWGVPRYSNSIETESYLYAGQALYPLAHRGEERARTADAQFYPRIESAFERIIRHGDQISNYWWEVTDKDGTRYFYGARPDLGLVENAVLRKSGGAIIHWALTQIIDTDGNQIRYYYNQVSDSGNANGTAGIALYPDYITYTGHNAVEGPFRIDFIRDRELGESLRVDKTIDCRLGLKQVQADLLRRVEISYNGELIRAYRLEYALGAFSKTLLQSVTEENGAGTDFYEHNFSYYDDVRQGGSYQPYNSSTPWDVPDDNIRGSILNPIPGMNGETSILGGSASDNFNVGGAATVGPNDFLLFSKDKTAGGTYAYGNSSDEGLIALVDINSDGLPDKVYRKGGSLHYRPNRSVPGGLQAFGEERPIHGISQFSTASTSSNSFGAEGNPPFAYVGYEFTDAKTTNNTYFTDFNGDGLLDIAQNGTVWFNHLDANGDPTFTTDSGDTPSPIQPGSELDDSLFEVDPQELEDRIDQYPLQDVIRMWEAPATGTVQIEAPVQLAEPTDPMAQSYQSDDGVRVAIQVGALEVWSLEISADDYTIFEPTGVGSLNVDKGDRIYFRVQSVFDGANDQVNWAPTITYTDGLQALEATDANNLDIARYQASEDFLLSAEQEVGLPLNGEIRISGTYTKERTSDDLEFAILLIRDEGGLPSLQVVHRDTLPADSIASIPLEVDYPVQEDDALLFRINSDTQIDWQAVSWVPDVYYLSSPDLEVFDQDGVPIFTYCPTVDHKMYNTPWVYSSMEVITDSTSFRLEPDITFAGGVTDSRVTLSVKGDSILYKTSFSADDQGDATPLEVELVAGDTIYIEYHFFEWENANLVESAGVQRFRMENGEEVSERLEIGYHSPINPDDIIFGPMYRHWGQFEYNGNRANADLPIDETVLMLDENAEDPGEISDDPDELEGLFDPTTAPFLTMLPDAKTQCYLGYDNFTFVSAEMVSSSRLGDDNILPLPPAGSGEGLTAPNRVTETTEHSIAGGLGFSVVTGTASQTWVESEITMDVMDFNGDRYPDIISGASIQYTNIQGGYGEEVINHPLPGHHEAKSEATGFTLGGSFVTSRPSNSGEPKGGGSNKRSGKAKRRSSKMSKNAKNAGNTAGDAVGISGTFSDDNDHAEHSWTDINGDGLMDKVRIHDNNDAQVALNYGYSFGAFEPWDFEQIQVGYSIDGGGGLGISLFNGSIAGGISITRTDNFTTESLEDVNGDGLPDIVFVGDPTTVRLNTGTGFGNPIPWNQLSQLDEGSATGESVNAAFTVCIPILFVKVCINPSTSVGRGVSRQIQQLDDVNGDGFPDILRSTNDSDLSVQTSTIGRTNLLRQVSRPLGGSFTMDYTPVGNSYEQPYSIWALEEVEHRTVLAGESDKLSKKSYTYAGGLHERHERAFFGFTTVIETDLDTQDGDTPYRTYTQSFANANYYEQGLLLEERWADATDQTLHAKEYTYELRDANTNTPLLPAQLSSSALSVFPALVQQSNKYYSTDGSLGLNGNQRFTYDEFGNLTRLLDLGGGHEDELVDIRMSYQYLPETYQLSTRDSIVIRDANGIVRSRNAEINAGGVAERIHYQIDNSSRATYEYEYDEFGNTTRIIRPANAAGEHLTYTYTYDDELHTYAIQETDSYGLSKQRSFDSRYGLALSEVDEYERPSTFTLDNFGRPETMLLPGEALDDAEYSYRYQYQLSEGARLHEERWDPEHNEALETYTYIDSDGILQQQQQTTEASETPTALPSVQWQVSGIVATDAFERTVAQHYPRLIANTGGNYQASPDPVTPSRYTYDALDRPLSRTMPDGSTYTFSYNFGTTPSGVNCQVTTLVDPLSGEHQYYLDTRSRLLAEAHTGPNGLIWTEYQLNALGEQTAVIDAAGNSTRYDLDMLGRLINLYHPDGGHFEYKYDAAGNLLSKVTPSIRSRAVEGAQINYKYDFERLVQIDYPFNPQNQVRYTWGDTSATDFRAGRVYLVEDASGAQETWYDQSGEVKKVVRTLIVNEIELPTFVSEYEYDSWGRLKQLYYPDGELITYQFDRSGRINGLEGEKEGQFYQYVRNCSYDKFGDRARLVYGNGDELRFEKDPIQNRYQRFDSQLGNNALRIQQDYTYDAIGNLTQINDATPTNESSGARGQQQSFSYDAAYRLEEALGEWLAPNETHTYHLQIEYDDLFNPVLQYVERIRAGAESSDTTTLLHDYQYDATPLHFASEIGDSQLEASPEGQRQIRQQGDNLQISQYDEEGRLVAHAQDGYISRYSYGADGRRAIRSHGPGSGVSLDATPLGGVNHGDRDFTLYVSPLLEVQADSFIKHYYLNNQRILTKKGTGYFASQLLPPAQQITAGNIDLSDRLRRLRELLVNFTEDLGVPPGHPSLPFFYLDNGDDPVVLPQLGDSDPRLLPPPGWPAPEGPPDPNGPPGHPVWYAAPTTPDDALAGYGYTNPLQTPEREMFYYHHNPFNDVLLISDTDGELVLQQAFLPFGSPFVTEEKANFPTHPGFQGRSIDQESGLYYLNGSYYDSADAFWLNINAEQDDQPQFSSYLLDRGRPYAGQQLAATRAMAQGIVLTPGDRTLDLEQAFGNDGGAFAESSFTLSGGIAAAAVEIATSEKAPKSGSKSGSNPSTERGKGGKGGGVVRNQGLLALRRQFQRSELTDKTTTQELRRVSVNTPVAPIDVQKQRNRRFEIRPGDWDGMYMVGNRYVQLGPDVDRKTVRRYRRVVRELK